MQAALVVAALCVGCGLPEARYRYESGCLRDVRSEVALDQAVLDANVELARATLEAHQVLLGEEFCSLFAEIPVYLYADDAGVCAGGECVGRFTMVRGIELQRDGRGLFHEMLHAIDSSRLTVGSAWHGGWDKPSSGRPSYLDMEKEWLGGSASPALRKVVLLERHQ